MKILAVSLTVLFSLCTPALSGTRPNSPRLKAAPAQQPTIAMITWRGHTRAEDGFAQGLKDFGYAPQLIPYNCSQDIDRLDQIILALEDHPPDLIYVFGTTATRHVMKKVTDHPIIFNIVTRPVASGIIAGWQSSGNNTTGVSSTVPMQSQIRAFQKVVSFTCLGVIYNPREHNSVIQTRKLDQIAADQGFDLVRFKIQGARDIPLALADIETLVDAVYLPSDSTIKTLGRQIMETVNASRLPSLAALEDMVVSDGAMIGLVPDYYQLGGLASKNAHRVLSGALPSTVPVVTSDHFNMTVNLHTAKQIGIHIPTAILVMADHIVR